MWNKLLDWCVALKCPIYLDGGYWLFMYRLWQERNPVQNPDWWEMVIIEQRS